ncbi:sensor histidine kinase [Roseateles sp. DXS20W]|uniref:histidine kinase n=1 Tax=Pelomonas lactea TaxID=3299030 RepID=A0ABW7GJ66_9BURK
MTSFPCKSHDWAIHVGGTVAICVIVGLLNYLIRGGQLGYSMLYSFAIGVQISACISLLQKGLEWLLRRWRGTPSAPPNVWIGWGWMMPCILLGSVLGFTGGQWLADTLTGNRSTLLWNVADRRFALSFAFTLLVSLLASMFFFAVFKLNLAQLQQAQAERQAAEARLALLQSQLEPHMLFNTLAHLRVLIKLRPDEAQQMLDRLIDYLRATLQASRATEHALADEFERLSDYLALMQLRMGARLRVHLALPAGLGAITIPPLLLQPLVENAIKHGLEPHVQGGELRVSALREPGRLVLEVADSGAGLAGTSELGSVGAGFGLTQVRERLAQRYGDAATFTLQPQPGGGSIARIALPT